MCSSPKVVQPVQPPPEPPKTKQAVAAAPEQEAPSTSKVRTPARVAGRKGLRIDLDSSSSSSGSGLNIPI